MTALSNEIELKPGDRRAYEVVDLRALRSNMKALYESLPRQMNIIAVVKANAYGLGCIPVSNCVDEFVFGYAVATFREAMELRTAGFEKPVLILGPVDADCYQDCVRYGIRPVIFTKSEADLFEREAEAQKIKAPFHIAVDTGMSRIGLFPDTDGLILAKDLASRKSITAEGIFTHLATMDGTDLSEAMKQKERFKSLVNALKAEGVSFELVHCANSLASVINNAFSDEKVFNGCRYGICLYGDFPSEVPERKKISVEPVASVYSEVTFVKTVPENTGVGYGRTYVTDREMRIATISFGYADGYPRSLSNKGEVLIRGHRVPIVGRVCMDQFMVDVTALPETKAGDRVTLIGRDGEEEITLRELEEKSGLISYELLCGMTNRVKRFYLD